MDHSFRNLVVLIILSVAIIFGWQHFFEKPRLAKLAEQKRIYNEKLQRIKQSGAKTLSSKAIKSRNDAIDSTPRLKINSSVVEGSISLKGLRFDDLTLLNYKKTINENSPNVELLSPSQTKDAYFVEFGWRGTTKDITYPGPESVWKSDITDLRDNAVANLVWISPENVKFKATISIDDQYLFTITQSIENSSSRPISAQNYGLVNRSYQNKTDNMVNILHQGMIGSIKDELQEYSYDKIKDKKRERFSGKVSWIGITDKYWLTALIPDKTELYNANYSFAIKNGDEKYQADFIGENKIVEPGETITMVHHLFSGAKKVDLLDKYEAKFDLNLFDRSIDFGWFYILTKPIFNAMNFFYKYVGNFGLSIMIVTILIKTLMFSLANKSYRSMKKMKKLQPEIERIKKLCGDDKTRLNQEVLALYKREKVNPVSGCLPLILQIPVFFSIYKVLYVTIEMRHAPFFGWIKDLSAPDPTTIFNLFGILPFSPPGFLMIGVWPIIMALTMYLQQKMTPQPTDEVQAQVMRLMPLMFLFMFSSFPVGLLIYWSWNNILSIIQQSYINRLSVDD
ncbi:MAG TPA: membrane protein insertase YidC [Candidatus Megaira endosymbiont of Nemacystus decipiens]|nr:membrane protein insertase YidC [Candidatus Megaera endosymbiont of Nemacystus decipiens]